MTNIVNNNPLNSSNLRDFQHHTEVRGQINVPAMNNAYDEAMRHNSTSNQLKQSLQKKQRVPLPMSSTVISDIIYPVQTKKGLKWGKNHRA